MMDEGSVRAMDKSVVEEVEDAYQFADQAPDPEPEALFTNVYAEGTA
jgi:TPP-dependent pyruvate/acetoin dehydrogenase alpha subunit